VNGQSVLEAKAPVANDVGFTFGGGWDTTATIKRLTITGRADPAALAKLIQEKDTPKK